MKHILRHGTGAPAPNKISEYQLGISSNGKLYTKINGNVVCLNDYSNEPLAENETRSYSFNQNSPSSFTIRLFDSYTLSLELNQHKINTITINGADSVFIEDGDNGLLSQNVINGFGTDNTGFKEGSFILDDQFAFKYGICLSQAAGKTIFWISNITISNADEIIV